ncbi:MULTISPECIES: acetamidase/formamidase family protein [Thermomonospora]|uniref:Formamidase n=1 Tax=Thermomonospora curvata (strain ATCC 19995 / DSM 43183 / JCM 3096 / KCTC 9072 / NBRC 15933 / NCIMB 10081 / Henssen B9) TaxID=471852 RepID=D1AB49_THECD|nr:MULTISPECIES: acetamidase/formamidase family protein [Thermomonospora]ACY98992.1 formamidase [Thermomonospora curvata DSM 43183]PKK13181.1 MAG: formamidase [Thermomonospora sp. CIF 1]
MLSPTVPRPHAPVPAAAQAVPGHNRWHPDIPGVAEVITGGSVRLECEGALPGDEAVLCGPIVVVGAEPGDVIVVDVLALGRRDGRHAPGAHPGVIGCAPAPHSVRRARRSPVSRPEGVILGRVRPGLRGYEQVAAEAVPTTLRGREIVDCAVAPLTAGSRILLPVHVRGAKLSVGDLHFPSPEAPDCPGSAMPGWIDLRVNLTKRGVERFGVTGPMLMPGPDAA